MGDVPFGLIEIVLAFGLILAFAGWEVIRNRRALERLRRERAGEPPR